MKKGLSLFFLFLFMFALLLNNSVNACQPRPNSLVIKCDVKDSLFQQNLTCLNKDCSFNVSKSSNETLSISIENYSLGIHISGYISEKDGVYFYDRFIPKSFYPELFSYLDSFCVENLTEITLMLSQEYPGGYNSVFEPYSSEQELVLIKKNNNNYGNCRYTYFKKVGDWLFTEERVRSYCHYYSTNLCAPVYKIDSPSFLKFLLINLSINALPYLLIYFIALIIPIVFIIYLFKRKELKLFFKPNKFNIFFTLFFEIIRFLYLYLSLPRNSFLFHKSELIISVIRWIIGFYLISSLIRYIYMRIRNR